MSYYFWLGIDAEQLHDARECWQEATDAMLMLREAQTEADGFITVHPIIENNQR